MIKISPTQFKLIIGFNVIATILIFFAAWWIINFTIDSNSAKFFEINNSIVEKNHNPILFLPQQSDTLEYYRLSKAELQNLNEHIKYLGNIVSQESDNYRSIIGNDINRLSIIATSIIGIIAFINVIFPLAVNYISTKDLQDKFSKIDKIESIENKLNLFDRKIIDIDLLKLRFSIEKLSDFEYLEKEESEKKEIFKSQLMRIKNFLNDVFSSKYLDSNKGEIERYLSIFDENLNRIFLSRTRNLLAKNDDLRSELYTLIQKEDFSKDDLAPVDEAIDNLVKQI